MKPEPLRLRDVQTVIDETGMTLDRVLHLRAVPEPNPDESFWLHHEWMEANALDAETGARLAREYLDHLGPPTGRVHDTGTGPIEGIAGGPHYSTLRSGEGECQHCGRSGPLRLVGDRWLCEWDACRKDRADAFRRFVKKAAA